MEILKSFDVIFGDKKINRERNVDLKKINEFVGQNKFKTLFEAHIKESLKNKENLPHLLLYGNPGLGKTQLSRKISEVLDSNFYEYSAISLTLGEIHKIFDALEENDILFIDEIHSLRAKIQEELYTPIQDFKFNGFELPRFTLIGATTDSGLLKKPLRDRFKLEYTFLPYSKNELDNICIAYLKSKSYGGDINKATEEVVKRSFGVPRLIKKYSDHVVAFSNMGIDIKETFNSLDIDEYGLTRGHRLVLAWLKHVKKPIGIDQLAQATCLSKSDIMMIYEPDLISMGLLTRSIRGRELTDGGKFFKG